MRAAWPLILARHPDASIDLIGMNPPDELRHLGPQVRVHGFVDDIRPYFDEATVAICPVRNGGGTRIKVLDALAMGMPLVSTSIGCEGIDVVPERDLLVGDTPEAFAAQIGRLFDDPALRQRLAASARQLAEQRYSWDALAAQLVDAYHRTLPAGEQAQPQVAAPTGGLAGVR
jgi:glycosyltransferase involved in cell wall biosynthesis